jgi:hypothetical protein
MIDARFEALPHWNRGELGKRRAHFKTSYTRTLDKLEKEIGLVHGQHIRIEAGYSSYQIRNDGWPKGGASPSHPGVVLYFDTPDGALCFPAGTYDRMESNLHAIALTLECLRAVDRYGVTAGHEQYRGFLALPAPTPQVTVEQAGTILAALSGVPAKDIVRHHDAYRTAYRDVARRLHPDSGADRDAWENFQNAAVVLEEHHKKPA